MNDVSVLIYSCDAYADIWNPFFTLFFRYWDCPYKVYITAESCKCEFENVTTLNTTGDNWTDRIRKAVEQIPTKYVIGMCEDMFFRRPVRQEIIDNCVTYMNQDYKKEIASFNFEMANSIIDESEYPGFGLKTCEYDYQKNCQPNLWRKEILLELLQASQSPWEWETSLAPMNYKYYVWNGDPDKLVFEYGYHGKWFGIQKGKWVIDDVAPLFEKEEINIDYSIRGIIKGD